MSIQTLNEFNQIYKYDIQKPIGRGGFGEVYKGINTRTHETIAIKKSAVSDAKGKYTLLNEFEKGASLSHPNLLKYLDCHRFHTNVGTFDFGILEYINGGDLEKFMQNLPSLEQLKMVLIGILEGLEYLHSKGIIHRDLKPSNVLINYEEGLIVPKIIDFGISKDVEGDTSMISNIVGSYEYMSPEQLGAGSKRLKPNSDLWTFGVIVYQMLSGELPFGSRKAGDSSAQIINKVMDAKAPINLSNIPDPFKTLIKICLKKDPTKRVQSASQCLKLLRNPEIIANRNKSRGKGTTLAAVKTPPKAKIKQNKKVLSSPHLSETIPKPNLFFRSIAFIIDSSIYVVLWFIMAMVVFFSYVEYNYGIDNIEDISDQDSIILSVITSIIPFSLYLIKDWIFRGRGIGKFMLGLKTIDAKSYNKCGFFQSILRNLWIPLLFLILSLMFPDSNPSEEELIAQFILLGSLYGAYLFVNFLFILIDKKGRKLSDFISGTRVVENVDLKIRGLL